MLHTCQYCEEIYESKRKSSKYCSDKCRVYASRISVTDSVTDKEVSVTKDFKLIKPIIGGGMEYCKKHPWSFKKTCGCK